MTLTASTTFDISDQTQSIIFSNPSMVDQISYSSNQITFSEISSFTLTASDMNLYVIYLQNFYKLLLLNFPSINQSLSLPWPLCEFDITSSNTGIAKLTYTQNSLGTNVYTINYLPAESSAGFAARSAPVVTTLQEFLWTVPMIIQYNNQITIY